MEWYLIIALLIGGVVLLMTTGLPVVFAFFGVNILGAFLLMGGERGGLQLIRNAVEAAQTFELLPVAFFILMGEIMFVSGMAARAIGAMDNLISRVPGRLSLVALAGGTMFSSLSGSTIANTAILSNTMLPEMYRRGYRPTIAIGPIVAVGGLAMLIPPSALAVLMGSIAGISISALLVASIIPAIVMALFFGGYVVIRCLVDPTLAPSYPIEAMRWSDRLKPLALYVLPLFAIFLVVVGSIVGGLATPTESAALGVLATVVAAACYGRLNWDVVRRSLTASLRFSVMILFIVCGSITFSQILSFSGASADLIDAVRAWTLSPYVLLFAMLAILLFLGCFMDQVSIMMIAMPIYMVILATLDFGVGTTEETKVWFGVLMLIMLEVSLATPPFGLLLFVAKGAAPAGTTMQQIIESVYPFILLALLAALTIIVMPQIALWLPRFIAG